jgi:hypothetical protein
MISRVASRIARPAERSAASLTSRQAEVLAYLRRHIHEQGFAPTTEELAGECHLGSPSGAHRMLKTLERKGYLRREPGRSRAIVLQDPVRDLSGANEEELFMLSLIEELQGAARDTVLRMAAEVSDRAIKGSLIQDAADRHALVTSLAEQLAKVVRDRPSSHGALTVLLGALRADSSWIEFLIDQLVFNHGSRMGIHAFATEHPSVQDMLLRVSAIAQRAAEQAHAWLQTALKGTSAAERRKLRDHARTVLQIQSLTARLIEKEARDEGLFEPMDASVLPEALR